MLTSVDPDSVSGKCSNCIFTAQLLHRGCNRVAPDSTKRLWPTVSCFDRHFASCTVFSSESRSDSKKYWRWRITISTESSSVLVQHTAFCKLTTEYRTQYKIQKTINTNEDLRFTRRLGERQQWILICQYTFTRLQGRRQPSWLSTLTWWFF